MVSRWKCCFAGRPVSLSESIYESGIQFVSMFNNFLWEDVKVEKAGEKMGWR